MSIPNLGHANLTATEWVSLHQLLNSGNNVTVDGHTLSLASVLAVASHGAKATLTNDEGIVRAVDQSVDMLDHEIKAGRTIYGVNTGFGGSADVRTSKVARLQAGLQQHLNVGILLPSDKGINSPEETTSAMQAWRAHALPVSVVRGMMLIRCNSLMRGHSGVRTLVVKGILALLENDMTPVVPLRGSISASGDLSPLSYIAGALEGNPGIYIRVGGQKQQTFMTADQALKHAGLKPILLQAKEGLGITNGTATSTAAACIAMHQANQLAVLTQLLTAMGTEALLGTAHNYEPFISATRPHPGQAEVASNILAFLSNSTLAPSQDPQRIGLAQDRYPLRTSPQWIGPQLENLKLANQQVQIEINSTTDNPLIDVAGNVIHHGGNFQAVSITSAMEKTSSAMQMLGKIIFQQCSELLNNSMNKGLPPNLSADDPSMSFTMKGFDVNMAAYMSELAHLAHPVSSHVQSAEMNNQAVNSLALVSARITLEAIELLSLISATYLYALCQALDLRALHLEFQKAVEPKIRDIVRESFNSLVAAHHIDVLHFEAWQLLLRKWNATATLDLADRGPIVAQEACGPFLEVLKNHRQAKGNSAGDVLDSMENFRVKVGKTLTETYDLTRTEFFEHQTTAQYLSEASTVMYEFVRRDLDVPMHRGLIDHPTIAVEREGDSEQRRRIIGTMASEIYVAMRNGRVFGKSMEALKRVGRANEKEKVKARL